MKTRNSIWYTSLIVAALFPASASAQVAGNAAYDLDKPDVFRLPRGISNISGIAFKGDQTDSISILTNPAGALYTYHLADGRATVVKQLAGNKHYQSLAFSTDHTILLRGNGGIDFLSFSAPADSGNTGEWQVSGYLPRGDYRAAYFEPRQSKYYVVSSGLKIDKNWQHARIYVLNYMAKGILKPDAWLIPDLSKIRLLYGRSLLSLQPSALSRHPITGDWFLLSAVNKLLVVANASWVIKEVYALDRRLFNDPQGLAFDRLANLYISNNENSSAASIFKFLIKNTISK